MKRTRLNHCINILLYIVQYIEICFEAFRTPFLNEQKKGKKSEHKWWKNTHLFISFKPLLLLLLFWWVCKFNIADCHKTKRNIQIGIMFPEISRSLQAKQLNPFGHFHTCVYFYSLLLPPFLFVSLSIEFISPCFSLCSILCKICGTCVECVQCHECSKSWAQSSVKCCYWKHMCVCMHGIGKMNAWIQI